MDTQKGRFGTSFSISLFKKVSHTSPHAYHVHSESMSIKPHRSWLPAGSSTVPRSSLDSLLSLFTRHAAVRSTHHTSFSSRADDCAGVLYHISFSLHADHCVVVLVLLRLFGYLGHKSCVDSLGCLSYLACAFALGMIKLCIRIWFWLFQWSIWLLVVSVTFS